VTHQSWAKSWATSTHSKNAHGGMMQFYEIMAEFEKE